jgi:hypothetical protein
VRLVEPGSFATGFAARAAAASRPRSPESPYAAQHATWDARKLAVLEKPQDPERVAEAIVASLADPAPFARVPVGPDAERLLGLRSAIAPDAWALLAAERNGLAPGPHGPGEVLSPEEVLAGHRDLAATLAAWRHGHLDHWEATPAGRAALDRLKERA